jgi:RNA polymerase sigma factor (sigma-70 family)
MDTLKAHLCNVSVYKNDDTKQVIEMCRLGNPAAQKILYNTFSSRVMSICMRYCKNRPDAEDVFQEVFIRVFDKIGTFSFQGSFEGWISRIAVNTALKAIKRRRLWMDLDYSDAPVTKLSVGNLYEIQGSEINELIGYLPRGAKKVFNLYTQGFTHKEISELLNISEGTSKSQLFAARRELKAMSA